MEDEAEEGRAIMKEEKSTSRMREEGRREVDKEELEDIMLNGKGDHDFSMNKFIAEELTKLMKIYATERDLGRKIAYSKAAAVIRNYDK
jgi:hypothetical protein